MPENNKEQEKQAYSPSAETIEKLRKSFDKIFYKIPDKIIDNLKSLATKDKTSFGKTITTITSKKWAELQKEAEEKEKKEKQDGQANTDNNATGTGEGEKISKSPDPASIQGNEGSGENPPVKEETQPKEKTQGDAEAEDYNRNVGEEAESEESKEENKDDFLDDDEDQQYTENQFNTKKFSKKLSNLQERINKML